MVRSFQDRAIGTKGASLRMINTTRNGSIDRRKVSNGEDVTYLSDKKMVQDAPRGYAPVILIVEDDDDLRRSLKQCLETEFYQVREIPDGIGVIRALEQERIDLIILDVLLPGVDGFELCRRVREISHWTPILMTTALDAVKDKLKAFDFGADDYITKPFSLVELIARSRALLRRGQNLRPPVLEVLDIQLDPYAKLAWRSGVDLNLASTELAVLEVLMRKAGLVVSRRSILKLVWGSTPEVTENIVDQYVAHLRRKVDRRFGRSDIETVYGVGYRLRI